MDFTYPKTEKLKSRTVINSLFSDGKTIGKYPLRLVYVENSAESTDKIKFGVSVSKVRRKFCKSSRVVVFRPVKRGNCRKSVIVSCRPSCPKPKPDNCSPGARLIPTFCERPRSWETLKSSGRPKNARAIIVSVPVASPLPR